MKFTRLTLVLCVCISSAHAQFLTRSEQRPTPLHERRSSQITPQLRAQAWHTAIRSGATPAITKSSDVIPAVCPELTASVCGYLPVPLDRRRPLGAKINIYFEVYPHTNSGAAQSAILVNFGGPAASTTGSRDSAQYLFASNLDVHDLLLIDDRGSGLSGTIDCEDLQHATAPFAQAESDCAAQLGAAASWYGSGDVAKDMEAVRAALGYDKVDIFGASYGGADAAAYATRFGEHVRSIVMDAPLAANAVNEFARLQFRTHSDPRMVRLVCARSLLCSPDHRNAEDEFADLIQAIKQHPIEGDTHDASGNPVHVRVDEAALLDFVVTYPQNFINTGEILAAGAALKQGDHAPLLRLAAEGTFTALSDSGDPTGYSAGDYYARVCTDAELPWNWSSDSIAGRQADLAQAVSDLPADYFAPFSRSATTGNLLYGILKPCIWWERPTPSSPMVPPQATYPQSPTLVLDGDIDNRVPLEESEGVADVFPRSTFVKVAEAGHYTIDFSPCAQGLVAQFIENLQADTTCASTPYQIFPAVGRFPLLAADARPAEVDSSGSNMIGPAERKVVTVSVATAIDALQRTFIGSGSGVGLRGGTFQTNFLDGGAVWVTTLVNSAFSEDVIVNGTVTWAADYSIIADLVVSGPGTAGGTLHMTGFWNNPGTFGKFQITGVLGGKNVAVLVPEA